MKLQRFTSMPKLNYLIDKKIRPEKVVIQYLYILENLFVGCAFSFDIFSQIFKV